MQTPMLLLGILALAVGVVAWLGCVVLVVRKKRPRREREVSFASRGGLGVVFGSSTRRGH